MISAPLNPTEVRFGDVLYPPGGTLGPRIQPTLEFVWVYTGEMTIWIDGELHYAPEGSTVLLLPGHEERIAFARDRETHHRYAHITIADLSDKMLERITRAGWMLPTSLAMATLVLQAADLQASTLPTAETLLRLVAVQMLWQYIGEAEQRADEQPNSAWQVVEMACRYVYDHLGDALTLEQIAAVASISAPHLIRLFKAQLHTTPMTWVWNQRVTRGLQLLRDSGLPIYSIAEQCGFQNAFHFSRRVKQATGHTPSAFRALAQHEPIKL